MMKKINCIIICAILLVFAVLPLLGGGQKEVKEEKVLIEFFQNKEEAVGTFDELIARFEEKYPDIDIEQNNVAEFETVLMTRLAKNDMPAIIGMGGTAHWGEMAKAGYLHDFSNDSIVDLVHEGYITQLKKRTGLSGVHGIPYAVNANTVLYNKAKFKELGLSVPKTWDELIAAAETCKAAGQTPFYLTLKDAWTAMVTFNALAANLHGDDFIEKRLSGDTSFQERYVKVAEKMLTLLKYGHDDNFGFGYDDGNMAFAKGESVMYIQGVWAIGSIKKSNPDIELGVFAMPVLNDPNKNRLVSGVDTLFSLAKDTEYIKEAKLFINFLLEPENAKYYIDQENQFSAAKGVIQNDPVMEGIRINFETGRVTGFPDHFYMPGMQVPNLVQEFLINGDVDAFLKIMDDEWDKVQQRQ
jgi:raffinose/stachyose/melibiose transport system substrate-binding protein